MKRVLLTGLLLAACDSAPSLLLLRAPDPLVDFNPDPKIVEVELVAGPAQVAYLPGKAADVWAYRDGARPDLPGAVPGPLLEAQQGDLVIIHFRNELPGPTTIHWHGLRLPAAADGSTATQTAVPPGGSFEYRFTARDAGTFWYHPHVDADVQVERGLYAPMVVRGGPDLDVATDRTLMLDDVKLSADGQLAAESDRLDIMLGRQGNVLLVNGQRGAVLEVAAGTRERWRLINAANGRYFNLALPGHRFLVVGWDGGVLPAPYAADQLLLAPGERYEVLLTFDQMPTGRLALQTLHYDRGHDIPDPGPRNLLEVVYGEPGRAARPLPSSWPSLDAVPTNQATPVRPVVLREQDSPAGAQFFINEERWPFNTPIAVRKGTSEIWEIKAPEEMDHPFHLHGAFFQVLDVGGAPPPYRGWKDTVNVPRGKTLRFAVRHETPGMWMFHCHILEHAERGMMGELMVEE